MRPRRAQGQGHTAMRFWKRKQDAPAVGPASIWPGLLAAVSASDTDLMLVAGPEDGGSVCTDWVGAVVSVSGANKRFPALVDAIEDGLFHPGCRHTLMRYPEKEDEAQTQFCTKIAVAGMTRRIAERDRAHTAPAGPSSEEARAQFMRWYDLARDAEKEKKFVFALHDCQEALAALTRANVFGDDQLMIERVLKGRMQTMLRAHQHNAAPGTAVE